MNETKRLGDLREKFFKRALWPKCFFVKPSKAETVTLAMKELDGLTHRNQLLCSSPSGLMITLFLISYSLK